MMISVLVASSRKQLGDLGPIPDEILPQLQALGHNVRFVFLEETIKELGSPLKPGELFVMKGHDNPIQMYGALLHSLGAPFVDPFPNCMTAENKILSTDLLRRGKIPVPDTWVTGSLQKTRDLLAQGRLLLKPHIGGMGRSAFIRDLRNDDDLGDIDFDGTTYIVQRFIEGPGYDLKLYAAGDGIFAVRKAYVPGKLAPHSLEISVEAWMRELVVRVGQELGLTIFGIDVIESPAGPVVVDVNYFPSFGGAKGGPEAISAHLDRCARSMGFD